MQWSSGLRRNSTRDGGVDVTRTSAMTVNTRQKPAGESAAGRHTRSTTAARPARGHEGAAPNRFRDFSSVPLTSAEAGREGPNASSDDAAIAGGVIGGLLGGAAGAGIGALAGAAIGSAVGKGGGVPGNSRTVDLQPVVFRTGPADPAPTGGSWARRLGPSNTIWGKLGVHFNDTSAVVIDNAALKTSGSNRAERDAVRAAHSNATRVCVFMTDNTLADAGGGGTVGGGAAGAKVALSDRGTSNTLLAHELGHVLGLDHPPGGADSNTIMEPSGSIDVDNPTRNTIGNFNRITWPAAGAPVTINPDS
jgi:hypothetical protein